MQQSGAAPEVVPLPDGGGATRSIGDTFEPDLHTGTGAYGVPLWFPPGRGKLRPEMTLSYSTGAGNGPFGMGWTLEPLTVTRRTDRGLPTYDDADTLLLGGGELAEVEPGRYRSRREATFFRVDRDGSGFVATDRRGRRYVLGDTADARVDHGGRVARWHVTRAVDRNGNDIRYAYHRDGGRLYLASIRYAAYVVTFSYAPRPDVLTDRRYGFPLTTALRCTGISYRFVDGGEFRRYGLAYTECPHSRLSLLASVTATGIRDGEEVALPPVRFSYGRFEPARRYRTFGSKVGSPPPRSLDDADIDLVDLDGTGLPGVVELGEAVRRYWPNLGEAEWGAPRRLGRLPAPVALSDPAVAIADLNGDAAGDLIVLNDRPFGYYRGEPGVGWTERARFAAAPAFDPRNSQLRLLDLDADGIVDALRSTGSHWYAYPNRGDDGWAQPVQLPVHRNGQADGGPAVALDDPRLRLADMTGDGLMDLVRVANGRIVYWPHLGFGRFGQQVALTFHPVDRRRFDPSRLFLSDVNGDGLADLLYVGADRVHVWINRSGLELAPLPVIRHTPRTGSANVALVDMQGTGTAGLLWSFPWSRRDPENYKYLDISGGVRPYLLERVDSGVGQSTEIRYAPSTHHLRAAREEGRPWNSPLPFPVATVTETVQRDLVTGLAVTKRYRYFDGWFDPADREFRGFGRVETLEVGDEEVPSTLTVSTFHQGRPATAPGLDRQRRAALTGRLHSLEVYDAAAPDAPLRTERNTYAVREVATGLDGRSVLFGHLTRSVVRVLEGTGVAEEIDTQLTYDDLGNVVEKREAWDAGDDRRVLATRMRFTGDTDRWILDLPVERVERDADGAVLSLERFFYDGAAFTGLPLGEVTAGNLSRHEQMVLPDALAAAVYGGDTPDFAALGYHRITDPDGQAGWARNTTACVSDEAGNTIRRRDERGEITEIDYDADGVYPVEIRNPLGHVTNVDYDRVTGRLARAREPNGGETRYRYDPVGRLRALIKPGDSDALPTVTLDHRDDALPLAVRTEIRQRSGEADTVTQVEYLDGTGQVLQKRVQGEDGRVVVDGWRRLNSRGWEAERTSPFFSAGMDYVADEGHDGPRRYRFTADALGRVVTTVTPDGRTSRAVYEPGVVTRYDVADTDDSPANAGQFDTPRRDALDAKGNLLAVTEHEDAGITHTTRYRYDALSRLLGITDAAGRTVATYRYDLLGRKLAVDHVDAGTRIAAHHPDGQIALSVDGEGRRTAVDCDALGRKLTVHVDGVATERYVYDTGDGNNLRGRLASVTDEAGTIAFSYTDRGLLAGKTRTVPVDGGERLLTVAYDYDAMERMTRVTYPDGTAVGYAYNERALVNRVDGVVDAIGYDELGRSQQITYANGVTEQRTYDPATFYLTRATVTGPARPEPYLDLRYTHDAVGNPLTITDAVTAPGHRRFDRDLTYDARYQLTGVQATLDGDALTAAYQYDAAGNFVRNGEFGDGELTYETGTNRLRGVRDGATEDIVFASDGNGNLVSTPGRTLRYDARGRLRRVETDDGTVVTYDYGFAGERVRKRVTAGGATAETLYLDDLYEETGGAARLHVFNGPTRVATLDGGLRVSHRDHVGNPVLVTDAAGDIVAELGYLPYGTTAYATGADPGSHRFADAVFDEELGLVYARSRYYDPRLGRFLTPDLFAVLNPEDLVATPLHLHVYLYAGNNPMRFVDDDGAWWKWVVGALVIAALVVATVVVGIATGGAGFAFGILLAASIGSAFGAGVGVYSAATSGGDPADGFLFGALVGGAAGALGFAAGAAVGAAGIGGAWGAILAGAAQGAVVGAANGAIAGYAGGAGSVEDVLVQAAIGFVVGAVVGGAVGYLAHSTPQVAGTTQSALTAEVKGTAAEPFWRGVGQVAGRIWEPAAQSALNSIATPVGTNVAVSVATGVAGFGHAAVYHDWDDIRAWLLEVTGEDEITVDAPEIEF